MAVTAIPGTTTALPLNTPPAPAQAPVCATVVRRVETPEAEVKQTITTCVQLKAPTEETAVDARKITAAAEKHRQSQVAQKIGQRNVDQNSYPPIRAGRTTPYGFSSADVGTAQDLLNRYYQPTATRTSAPRYEPLAKDDCLGPKTREQLLAYQKAHNLPGGGDLTPETLASLQQTAGKGRTAETDGAARPKSPAPGDPAANRDSVKTEQKTKQETVQRTEQMLETPEKRAQASKLLGDTLEEWKKNPVSPELVSRLGTLRDQLEAGKIGVAPALQQFRGLNSEYTNVAVNKARGEAEAWQTAANLTRVVRDGSVVFAGALAAPVLGVPGALASFGTAALAGTTLSVGSSALSAASAPDEQRQRFLSELQDPSKHLTLGFLSGLGALTMPTTISPVGRPLPPGGDVLRPQLPGGTPPQLPSSNVNHFSGATIDIPRVVVK